MNHTDVFSKKHSAVSKQYSSLIYMYMGESNGKLPLRTCPGCSVPEPYRSLDWALVPAQTSPRADY